MRKIIIYKSISDYEKTFTSYLNKFKNLELLVIDYVSVINNFNFKEYDTIITYNFDNEEKDILSNKLLADSRIYKNYIDVIHKCKKKKEIRYI